MEVKELKVGDRVRVYGWVQMSTRPYRPRYGGPATFVSPIKPGKVFVRFDKAANGEELGDQNHYEVDLKQCLRLKPRKKRREFWMALGEATFYAYEDESEARKFADRNGFECIKVREVWE